MAQLTIPPKIADSLRVVYGSFHITTKEELYQMGISSTITELQHLYQSSIDTIFQNACSGKNREEKKQIMGKKPKFLFISIDHMLQIEPTPIDLPIDLFSSSSVMEVADYKVFLLCTPALSKKMVPLLFKELERRNVKILPVRNKSFVSINGYSLIQIT